MLDAKQILNKMTLKEKIAQMFLQYYQGYDDMPEKFQQMNQENLLGGFIFFSGNNVKSLEQLHKMNQNIQKRANDNAYGLPFLLTIDQEGGQLAAIFNGATLFPGNMSLGLANDPDLAYQQGQYVAKELRYAGINLTFAPVLDVDYDVVNGVPIVDNRRYSHDPEVVAKMGTAYVKGLQDGGVLACGKHFPGMRITEVDTHFAVDRSPYDVNRLNEVEMMPFKSAIAAGLHSIMTHHGIFESLDAENPASLSPTIISHLRNQLGFKGLIVTDDLVMQAILHQYGEKEPIKKAIQAGSDLIISTCASDWFVDYVYECVQNGDIDEALIHQAAERIVTYKVDHCMHVIPDEKPFIPSEGRALAQKIAEKGLILYKGNPAELPVVVGEGKKLGILFGNPARLVMSDATNLYDISIKDILRSQGFANPIKEAIMPWHPTKEEIISLVDVGIISDVILFTTVNAYRFEQQLAVLKSLRQWCPNKRIIAVATRSPMDAPLLAEYADEVIITGGITENTFRALLNNLFGDGTFYVHPPIGYLN